MKVEQTFIDFALADVPARGIDRRAEGGDADDDDQPRFPAVFAERLRGRPDLVGDDQTGQAAERHPAGDGGVERLVVGVTGGHEGSNLGLVKPPVYQKCRR